MVAKFFARATIRKPLLKILATPLSSIKYNNNYYYWVAGIGQEKALFEKEAAAYQPSTAAECKWLPSCSVAVPSPYKGGLGQVIINFADGFWFYLLVGQVGA